MAGDFSIPPQTVAEAIEEAWAQRNDADPPDKSRKNWFKPDPNVIVLTAAEALCNQSDGLDDGAIGLLGGSTSGAASDSGVCVSFKVLTSGLHRKLAAVPRLLQQLIRLLGLSLSDASCSASLVGTICRLWRRRGLFAIRVDTGNTLGRGEGGSRKVVNKTNEAEYFGIENAGQASISLLELEYASAILPGLLQCKDRSELPIQQRNIAGNVADSIIAVTSGGRPYHNLHPHDQTIIHWFQRHCGLSISLSTEFVEEIVLLNWMLRSSQVTYVPTGYDTSSAMPSTEATREEMMPRKVHNLHRSTSNQESTIYYPIPAEANLIERSQSVLHYKNESEKKNEEIINIPYPIYMLVNLLKRWPHEQKTNDQQNDPSTVKKTLKTSLSVPQEEKEKEKEQADGHYISDTTAYFSGDSISLIVPLCKLLRQCVSSGQTVLNAVFKPTVPSPTIDSLNYGETTFIRGSETTFLDTLFDAVLSRSGFKHHPSLPIPRRLLTSEEVVLLVHTIELLQAAIEQGKPIHTIASIIPNLENIFGGKSSYTGKQRITMIELLRFGTASLRSKYRVDLFERGIHLIKAAIPQENSSLQETIDSPLSASLSISTASLGGSVLRICTILLEQGKNPLYFAASLVPKIVGKNGYAWAWPGAGLEDREDRMMGIIILNLIETVVSLNVVNVVAFHGPPAFLSSIVSDEVTTSYEKKTAAACIVASIVNQLKRTPAVAFDLISHGLDLIGWAIDSSPTDEIRAIVHSVESTTNKTKGKSIINSICKLAIKSGGGASSLLLCRMLWRTALSTEWVEKSPALQTSFGQVFARILRSEKRSDIRIFYTLFRPEFLKQEKFRFVFIWFAEQIFLKTSSWLLESLEQILKGCNTLTSASISAIDAAENDREQDQHQPLQQHFANNEREPTEDSPIATENPIISSFASQQVVQETLEALKYALSEFTEAPNKHLFDELKIKLGRASLLQAVGINHDGGVPEEVREDDNIMQVLTSISQRLEHIQRDRFGKLRDMLAAGTRWYLMADVPIEDKASMLVNRASLLNVQLSTLPFNVIERELLTQYGYRPDFFDSQITVAADTYRCTGDENLSGSLSSLFRQYCGLLQRAGIKEISIGQNRPPHAADASLFNAELSVEELRSRRASCVRVLKEAVESQGAIADSVMTLLVEEERVEEQVHAAGLKSELKPVRLKGTLVQSFIDCASSCSGSIVGCYAPNGDHCQKPLEVGIRCNGGFISICDEKNTEIESVELLFTDQGVLVYSAYTNGHVQNTEPIYTALFNKLLEDKFVPAIILLEGHPKPSIFRQLQANIPNDPTGCLLSCRFDIESSGERSYFDARPTEVRSGIDCILTPQIQTNKVTGKANETKKIQETYRRNSRTSASLDGILSKVAIQAVIYNEETNSELQSLRILGKEIALAISTLLGGKANTYDTLMVQKRFDFERWRHSYPSVFPDYDKSQILKEVSYVIDTSVISWINDAARSPRSLMSDYPRPVYLNICTFLDHLRSGFMVGKLQVEIETDKTMEWFGGATYNWNVLKRSELLESQNAAGILCNNVRDYLQDSINVTNIKTIPPNSQRLLMRWIFRNEDRVWRARGGRSDETLDTFLSLLRENAPEYDPDHYCVLPPVPENQLSEDSTPNITDPNRKATNTDILDCNEELPMQIKQIWRGPSFPGVVVFLPEVDFTTPSSLQKPGAIIAYSVGECVFYQQSPETATNTKQVVNNPALCYEIVTAWTDPGHRGLGLAVRMYMDIILGAPKCCTTISCDILKDTLERIINTVPGARLAERIGLLRFVLLDRCDSYESEGEHFERIVLHRQASATIIHSSKFLSSLAVAMDTWFVIGVATASATLIMALICHSTL